MVHPVQNILILVLYSRNDRAWKIADFGLTSEGTSKRCNTTRYSRGTSGYRAPELLKEEASYNNKVDIWAVGCILYELASRKKAFTSDFHVLSSAISKDSLRRPPFLLLDKRSQNCLSELIFAMLDLEWWRRPTATDLLTVLYLLTDPKEDLGSHFDPLVPDALMVYILREKSHLMWSQLVWRPKWYPPSLEIYHYY